MWTPSSSGCSAASKEVGVIPFQASHKRGMGVLRHGILPCIAVAITVIGFGAPRSAFTQGVSANTGNDLLPDCQAYVRFLDNPDRTEPTDAVNGPFCVGYIAGVVDDNFLWELSGANPPDRHSAHLCIPSGVNPNQAVRVVARWLGSHPERLHEPAVELVIAALRDGFPCQSSH